MATKRKSTPKEKTKTLGFVNWTLVNSKGEATMRSKRGFPIFLNPEYPDDREQLLIKAAEENGGIIELTMKVKVFACDSDAVVKLPSVADMLS